MDHKNITIEAVTARKDAKKRFVAESWYAIMGNSKSGGRASVH